MNRHASFSVLAAGLLAGGLALAQQAAVPSTDPGAQPVQAIAPEDLGRDDIRKVQSALNQAGYDAGAVDGVWGRGTISALREFQEAKGLRASGRLDEETALALGFSRDEFLRAAPDAVLEPGDVRQVQEALNREGFKVGAVDGVWGPATRSALGNFQRSKGLEPSGELDRDTVLALGLSVSEFAAGEFDHGPAEPDPVDR